MGMQLPEWAGKIFQIATGDGWPEADEDALWALAREWAAIGGAIDALQYQLMDPVRAVRRSDWDGPAARAFALAGQAPAGRQLAGLATGSHDVSNFIYQTGVNVQYMKIIVLEELVLLAAQISQLLGLSGTTFGASLAAIPALAALGRLLARLATSRLGMWIMSLAIGEAMQLALDSIAQAAQLAAGTRTHWDEALTANAAITGAVSGVLGPITQGAAGRLFDPGRVKGVLGRDLTAGLRQVAGSAAHEYFTSGVTGVVTRQGWTGSPWDLTAGATEGTVEALTQLRHRRGGLPSTDALRHLEAVPHLDTMPHAPDAGPHAATSVDVPTGGFTPRDVPPTGGTGTSTGGERRETGLPADQTYLPPDVPHWSTAAAQTAPVPAGQSTGQPTGQPTDTSRIGQQPASETVSAQGTAGLLPQQQQAASGAVRRQAASGAARRQARDGTSLAARLRGEDRPRQHPSTSDEDHSSTPVEVHSRSGGQPPIRHSPGTPGDKPIRRLSTRTPQVPTTTPTAQSPDARPSEHVNTAHVNTAGPETSPTSRRQQAAQAANNAPAIQPERTHQQLPRTAQHDPALPTHPAQPAAPANSLLTTAAKTFTKLKEKLSNLTCYHPCCRPERTQDRPAPAVEDRTAAEDRDVLTDYTIYAYQELNGYLRDPVGYTQTLRQDVVAEIRKQKVDRLIEANDAKIAAGHPGQAIRVLIDENRDNIAAEIRDRAEEIRTRTREKAAEIQTATDRVSAALHRLPPSPGTTYRGVRYPEHIIARYDPGYIVTEAAFTSTSHDLQPALASSATGNVLIEITGDSGRDISFVSTYDWEKEVLYDKGTRFQVVSKTWREDLGRWWIVMREVAASRAPNPIDGRAADGAPAERAPELSELVERAYDAALTESARRVAKAEAYAVATRLGLAGDGPEAARARDALSDRLAGPVWALLDDAHRFTEADHARVTRIEARQAWQDAGVSVAELVDRASSAGELYQAGVRPQEIARVATPAVLRRLFPGLPGLSEVQARELAELLRDPRIGQMLAETWGSPATTPPILAEALLTKLGGHPELVHAMIQVPELRHALAARPETLDHLASHHTAIDAVGAVVEDIRTRGAQAVLADGIAQPAPTPLTDQQRAISQAIRPARPVWYQDGFDVDRRDDPAYRQAFMNQLYEAAYGPGYARGTIAEDSAQGELTRIAHDIAEKTGGTAGVRLRPKDAQRARDKTAAFGNRADELLDLAGARISYDRLSDLYEALEMISRHPGLTIVALNDRFLRPMPAGYRDVQMNVRISNGHIGELQLHLTSMTEVLAWEHSLYEIERDLNTLAQQRPLNPIESAIRLSVVRKAQEAFWDALQPALTHEHRSAGGGSPVHHRETTFETPTTTEAPVTAENPSVVEDPATVENSTIAEDRRALQDYSREAHVPLNRYLRNPIHYTASLASAMVMAIEERILEGVDEVGGEKFADDLEALGQVSTRAAMIWRHAMAIAVEIATEIRAPRTSAAISAGAQIRMEELRSRISARREEILTLADEVVAEIGASADRISEALYRLPPSPGTTYRGSVHPEELLAHCTPGQIITESAFTSTSRDLEPVLNISKDGNVLFEITGASGRDISSYSFVDSENEVLYDKGTYFQVVSRTWVADLDRWWIVMREVPVSRLGQRRGGPQVYEAGWQADSPAPHLIGGRAADGAPAELSELAERAYDAALTENVRRVAKVEAYAVATRLGLTGNDEGATFSESTRRLLDDAHRFTEADHARVARIEARQAWQDAGVSVAELVDRASSAGELYQAGVRPQEIARVATPAVLRRLFPGLPGLSEVQARELAELLRDPRIGQMLAETWGSPATTPPILAEALLTKLGGHPELVHAMVAMPELRHALAARPETLDHLASHHTAIDAVSAVVEDIRTRGAQAVLADDIATPAPTPLTERQRAISAAARPTEPVWRQDGFDAARRDDPAYRQAFMNQLYEAAYGPDYAQGTITVESAQGELARIAIVIADLTDGAPAVRLQPKDPQQAWDEITGFGNRADELLDLARVKISFDRLSDLYEALEMISNHPGATFVAFHDRFVTPTLAGYRDVQISVRTSNGHIGEFQLRLKSMDDALMWKHTLDQVERDVTAQQEERPLEPIEEAMLLGIVREAQRVSWNALQPALIQEGQQVTSRGREDQGTDGHPLLGVRGNDAVRGNDSERFRKR